MHIPDSNVMANDISVSFENMLPKSSIVLSYSTNAEPMHRKKKWETKNNETELPTTKRGIGRAETIFLTRQQDTKKGLRFPTHDSTIGKKG